MKDGKKLILIADDEHEIRDIISLFLGAEGYEILTAGTGAEVLELSAPEIDLYILDINMPELSGLKAAAELRKSYDTPIIFLTAYSGETDKVMAFSVGADDYIVKPFSNLELLMRVRAILRRSVSQTYPDRILEAGKPDSAGDTVRSVYSCSTEYTADHRPNSREENEDIKKDIKEKKKEPTRGSACIAQEIDPDQQIPGHGRQEGEGRRRLPFQDAILDLDRQMVEKDGEEICLTYTEFRILELMVSNRKKIYSLDNIYSSIWQEEAVGDSAIMVHIKNIRKKLKDNSRNPFYIKTAWGRGYYVD